MKFTVDTHRLGNPRVSFLRLGYHPGKEGSFERRVGAGKFPRFHAYLRDRDGVTEVSLHFDARPHSYEGFSAHVGEYDTDIVREEAERIRASLL